MVGIWQFFQQEILGIQWLNEGLGILVAALGLDPAQRIGASIQFFVYDVIKIMVLLAFLVFVFSWLQSYFPPERTRRILCHYHGFSETVVGALMGTVTPFCSCSSIPVFYGFTSAGLPLSVTFAFLISSPLVDLSSILALMTVFGWKTALIYVAAGLVIAVAGGTLIQRLRMQDQFKASMHRSLKPEKEDEKLSKRQRFRFALHGAGAMAHRVFPFVLIGVALGTVIRYWIPEETVVWLLGSENPFGVLLAVVIGLPMYADIFSSLPIAEALLAHGAAPGAPIAFMMSATMLSVPAFAMLRKTLKPRLLATYTAICFAGCLMVGYLFNFLAPYLL